MTEATRLEESLGDAQRERFDLASVVAGCVDGYRAAYRGIAWNCSVPSARCRSTVRLS